MKNPEILWLSRHDVEAVTLGPIDCIDLVHKAMEWQADGSLEVPAKVGIHPPKGRHINAMPAFITPLGAAGLKWVADFPENKKLGLATIHGLIVLNDAETGVPFCMMEGALITAKRTAAMTALSLQACALPSVTLGAMVGTGTEAFAHAITLPKALPTLKTLRIVGRELAAAERFCRDMTLEAGIELIPFLDREQAVRGADVIVTVTNAIKHAAARRSQPGLLRAPLSRFSTMPVKKQPYYLRSTGSLWTTASLSRPRKCDVDFRLVRLVSTAKLVKSLGAASKVGLTRGSESLS